MKKLFVAGIAAAALYGAPTLVADTPANAQAGTAVAQPYDWSGCYVGGNVGGIWSQSSWATPFLIQRRNDSSSVTGGAQVGCNYMSPNRWVLGIEGDWSWMNLDKANPTLFPGERFRTKWDWSTSVRGRVGYAPDRTLLYLTVGPAWSRQSAAQFLTPDSELLFATHSGWTFGAGVEHAFNQNWLLGVEYLYSEYEDHRYQCSSCGPVFVNNQTNEVRLRMSYKFGR